MSAACWLTQVRASRKRWCKSVGRERTPVRPRIRCACTTFIAEWAGPGPGKAKCMVTIYTNHVIGENFWLWRADHGSGRRLEGKHQRQRSARRRRQRHDVRPVRRTQPGISDSLERQRRPGYFYQSEMPYDPPFEPGSGVTANKNGFASYKVGDKVTTHEAWGLGVYHFFYGAAGRRGECLRNPCRSGHPDAPHGDDSPERRQTGQRFSSRDQRHRGRRDNQLESRREVEEQRTEDRRTEQSALWPCPVPSVLCPLSSVPM